MKRFITIILLTIVAAYNVAAQNICGRITNAQTGEPVPYVNVVYEGAKTGVQSDEEGNYCIAFHNAKLTFSSVGYEAMSVKPKPGDSLNIKLTPTDLAFGEMKVVIKRQKYSRKDNPAVEFMRKVIEAKKFQDLRQHDYYSVEQYNKLNFALADVTPKVFEEGQFKNMPFLKEHVEVSPETGKLILPLTVEETVTDIMYRKSDDLEKRLVIGKRQEGINQLVTSGDMLTQMLNDFFTEINLYEDDIRLLQYQFISPLSSRNGISFYRYFLADTCYVEGSKCIEVQFTPNNKQDFGFTGSLFVTTDSTYRVKKATMGVPIHTGVNFVDLMKIEQVYEQLPSGEQALIKDNMLLVMKFVKENYKVQAKRTTEYSKFDFSFIPDKTLNFKGKVKMQADAQMKEDEFWEKHRTEKLTVTENRVNLFLDRVQNMKYFKPVIWVGKAFIGNYIETTMDPKKGSKIDYGPVNTTIGYNDVDGLRLRASLLTTAHLNPHLFFKGYAAYGFGDQRWKGMGEVTYSFNKKKYLPREFPVRNLTFSYTNDVTSPSDVHMPTDKDNIFIALKWTKVDHMVYNENFKLYYDSEWENGLRMMWKLSHDKMEPCGALFYQPVAYGDLLNARPSLDFSHNIRYLRTTDFTWSVQWQPGAQYLNTKDRRILVNKEAPLFGISHTVGLKGLWSDYTYNSTEMDIYKRWWVHSWGKIDTRLKGGIQWNKVPFPLLFAPWANTSYIREDNMFNLIKNMEFLNDRYVSFMGQWDLNGKILNRIPLIRRLKWREYFGVNALWGQLTDKNNPYLAQNADRTDIFYFPSRIADGTYEQQTMVMDPHVPYVEAYVGIHNIFKLLWIQYVHRLTYNSHTNSMYERGGVRFIFRVTF